MNKLDYSDRREALYGPLRAEGTFTWDFMYGEEYALADIHLITNQEREELANATDKLHHIFNRIVQTLHVADETFLIGLGIPDAALNAMRVQVDPALVTLYGAFDLAWTAEGLKLIEFNAETASLVVESFFVNNAVCRYFDVDDPNKGLSDQFHRAFHHMVERYRELGFRTENIIFSSLDWHEEDAATTKYLLKLSGLNARFVPLADLRVYEDELYFVDGDFLAAVHLWFHLHPLEKLAEEKDGAGYPTGTHLLDLAARKKVGLINPPSAFLAQTKSLQAVIWNLHESNLFFTPEEHAIIETYMLPTYFENRFQGRTGYVSKPIWGREGGGVTLHHPDGDIIEQSGNEQYWDQPVIYQQMVDLPQLTVQNLKGTYTGHALWRSFVVGGEPSAILVRLGNKITGNESFYLPVGIKGNDKQEEF